MKLVVLLLCCLVAVHAFKWYDTVDLHAKAKQTRDMYEVNENQLFGKYHGAHVGQGDILFPPGEEERLFDIGGKRKRDALKNKLAKWPGAIVPFVIESMNAAGRAALRETIAEYNAKTCIKLVPRNGQRDYVNIIAAAGCYSYVGKVGGKQPISIGRGCEYKSTVIHEFMHALGFFHEQSRVDRDSFVNIFYQNMRAGTARQFAKQSAKVVQTFGHGYDYDSVMHYDRYAFSTQRDVLATIEAKGNKNRKLGQYSNGGLSAIDVLQLNAMYCAEPTVETTEEPAPDTTEEPAPDTTEEPAPETESPITTTKRPRSNGLTPAKCLNRMRFCERTMKGCRAVFSNA